MPRWSELCPHLLALALKCCFSASTISWPPLGDAETLNQGPQNTQSYLASFSAGCGSRSLSAWGSGSWCKRSTLCWCTDSVAQVSLLSAVSRAVGVELKGIWKPQSRFVTWCVRKLSCGSDLYSLAREVQGVGSRATSPDAWAPGTAPPLLPTTPLPPTPQVFVASSAKLGREAWLTMTANFTFFFFSGIGVPVCLLSSSLISFSCYFCCLWWPHSLLTGKRTKGSKGKEVKRISDGSFWTLHPTFWAFLFVVWAVGLLILCCDTFSRARETAASHCPLYSLQCRVCRSSTMMCAA